MTNPKGLQVLPSNHSVKETIDRLQANLQHNGITIYARIDQQAEVAKAGQSIPPLEFLMFGNPKAGGLVMAAHPEAAIDLPLKVIAWEDSAQKVWVAYNEAQYLQDRFGLAQELTVALNIGPVVAKSV